MNEVKENVGKKRSSSGSVKKRRTFSRGLRLKAVKLYLEEKLPVKLICQELGVNRKAVWK
jgi:transposase-like protein